MSKDIKGQKVSRVSKDVEGVKKCRGCQKISRVSKDVKGVKKCRGCRKMLRVSKGCRKVSPGTKKVKGGRGCMKSPTTRRRFCRLQECVELTCKPPRSTAVYGLCA